MPHLRYNSGSVRAVAKLRTTALASRSPPICAKVVSGVTCTNTRPVRLPYFSPSLVKTSSMRRWIAHCWLAALASGSERPEVVSSAAMSLDARRLGRGEDLGLVEDPILHEDRGLRADGQRDGVRRPRVELDLAAARVEDHGGVVDAIPEVGDDHLGHRHLEPAEEGEEEVVSERARRHAILEGESDARGLGGPDAHGETPLVALALEDDRRVLPARIHEQPDDPRLL